jgi:hypothetical protein
MVYSLEQLRRAGDRSVNGAAPVVGANLAVIRAVHPLFVPEATIFPSVDIPLAGSAAKSTIRSRKIFFIIAVEQRKR